jgi:class 3 adenylate cyclase/pimeloyl-ACP methyl ester carboxylesterase
MRPFGGTLTVLFTDLVGSTELMQRLGDEAAERVRRSHYRLLRDAVTARGGQEVKTLGDGFMVVFPSAVDAVACAVAVQQGVFAYNEREGGDSPLGLRTGLEAGEPIRDEGDYFGMPVVVAKRLCDSASGGQIIVSDVVRNLVGSKGDYTFHDLGPRSLKGISDPVTVYDVAWQPAADASPFEPVLEPRSTLPHFGGERTAFVGRGDELEALRRSWSAVRAGQRKLVMLAGDPGIGKTRLATEFALACQESDGAEVLFGRADESSRIPYQPFVNAIEDCTSSRSAAELRGLLGPAAEHALLASELARTLPDDALGREVGEPTNRPRQRLFEALNAVFTTPTLRHPLMLLLDDLHWADQASFQLLRHIMRQRAQSRLLVLGTYRESDVARDHPLAHVLADLRRDGLVEAMLLAGLPERDVGSLVAAWAGQHSPAELTSTIRAQTEGNPLFVEEVLRHLTETGAMFDEDGRLRAYVLAPGVPQGVKDVIAHRLARLSDDCNNVLTIASVIGRDFGLDALQRASDLSDEQLIDALEEAVDASLVREVAGAVGRYSFAHALVYEALYEELTTTRRVRLHGQTLQYADNEGVKLAYEVLGAMGPSLIATGLSNCPAVRTRNRTTAKRWERLSAHCRLILYDRRGVGLSSVPERGYSLFASVEDIRAVLDAAGVERTILWGATDGGPLAIAFAVHYPERVAGLMLLGTTAKFVSDDDFSMGTSRSTVESFLRTDAVDRGRAVSQWSEVREASALDNQNREAIVEVMGRVPRSAWSKVILSLGAADARSLLSQVHTPTLIIHDPDNTYIPVQAAHFLHEQIAGSELLITPEWGLPLFGETVYNTIEAFMEKVTTSPL